MGHQINVLSGLKKPVKHIIRGIGSNLLIGCRHALWASQEVYCTLRRENIGGNGCEDCPNFNAEPLEYSLFRRM